MSKRRRKKDDQELPPADREEREAMIAAGCWLCARDLGERVQWHHAVPKSRGGRRTVPIHPICHATLHANFSNAELEAIGDDPPTLRMEARLHAFLDFISGKAPDFHAPTRRRKG